MSKAAFEKIAAGLNDAIASIKPDENGWIPIASAPRDGRQIWLFDPNIDPDQFVGSYGWLDLPIGHPDNWAGWVFADEILINHCDYEPEPTHWRPLPEPPVQGEPA